MLGLFLVFSSAPQAFALVGPHTYTDENGSVFLGGDYIELGLSGRGSFGTDNETLPPGFYGTDNDVRIGMSTNPTGFGVAPDLRMDFFMPGSPEERWVVGYKQSGTPHTGSNSLLRGANGIPDNAVTDESSGDMLKARSVGTFDSKLQVTQVISFKRGDKFFENKVTLKNIDTSNIDSVRYMRSFDPDNTVYQGGDYTTHNYIPYTHQAGDGKAVVIADANIGASDPVFAQNGSYSPILFYSADTRARVSTYGFSNSDPYAAAAYDSAEPKGTDVIDDQAITIAFDTGTLTPGASETVSYYTSLDNRDFSAVLADIQASSGGSSGGAAATAIPNDGDANDDGTQDTTQTNVAGLVSPVTNKYALIEAANGCTIHDQSIAAAASLAAQDNGYSYPAGLMNFTLQSCGAPGYTTTVTQYYYGLSGSNFVLRKYNPNTKKYATISGATISQATIGGQAVTKVSYQITDGGPLDQDGTANGTIVDPAGLALPALVDAGTNVALTTSIATVLTASAFLVRQKNGRYRFSR